MNRTSILTNNQAIRSSEKTGLRDYGYPTLIVAEGYSHAAA